MLTPIITEVWSFAAGLNFYWFLDVQYVVRSLNLHHSMPHTYGVAFVMLLHTHEFELKCVQTNTEKRVLSILKL